MKMGRERTVLCWDIEAAVLRMQIEQAEAELAETDAGHVGESASDRQRANRLSGTLADLHRQLRNLGTSPRAKMG